MHKPLRNYGIVKKVYHHFDYLVYFLIDLLVLI